MSGRRKIGPVLATVLVAGNMIGSGIFLLPATLAAVGSITVTGWVIAMLGALVLAAVFAKLAQLVPAQGGLCAYASEALGPYMGFQASALYWFSCWLTNLAIAVAATGYLASFLPALAAPLPATVATVALIWGFTLLNVLGPRAVCQLGWVAITVGLVPILLVALAGWWFFDPHLFRASWNVQHLPAWRAVPDSLVLVFWAFTGLESASIATSVVENPQRNVPLATFGGVLVAGVLYLGSCSVIMGLIPAQRLATSTAPFADAVHLMLGPLAGAGVALAALVKLSGSLAGWILVGAQMGAAGAARGLFPRIFARLDGRGVPVPGLLIVAALSSVLAFASMSPTLAEQFGKLIEVTTILTLLVYLYACVGVWHYAQLPATSPEVRAQLLRYQPLALIAMLFCLALIIRSDTTLLALAAITVFLTYPLYPFVIRARASKSDG
jgi:arginine:agmatine antiporter